MIETFRDFFPFYLTIILSCLLHPAQAYEQADFYGVDQYIEELRNELGIPGVAVAIVENDITRMATGYGVANINGSA